MSPDEFAALFDSFRISALRVETHAEYGGEADRAAMAKWPQSGRARPGYSVRTSEFAAKLAATSIAGLRWQRVRLVALPLNRYTTWELAALAEASVLGEETRVLVKSPEFADLDDAWIFDRESDDPVVVAMRYDAAGDPLEHDLVSDAAEIADLIRAAESAWGVATPLIDFMSTSSHLRHTA